MYALHERMPGTWRIVEIDGYEEALVLNVDGVVCAISNTCPHAGAALQRGHIVYRGYRIVLSAALLGVCPDDKSFCGGSHHLYPYLGC
jgi:nitrite reductase/ring-hydroxylating ferredoxin subunit